MKKNVGRYDAAIRYSLAVVIAIAGIYYESWWGLLALAPIITAYIGVCPLYKLLGINTSKRRIKVN